MLSRNIQQRDFAQKQIYSNNIKQLLYIVSFVSIFFDLQIYSILQLKNKSRKTKDANKTTTNRKEVEKAKKIEVKTRETKIEIKIIETSTEADAKTNAETIAITATTTVNKKYLLRLCRQFVCIYISFVFKTILILSSCLLLFNNL